MNRLNLIEEFLFDKSMDPNERKERIRLAYWLYHCLDEITSEIREDTMNRFLEKLKKSDQFKDYQIKDRGLGIGKSLCIFKPEWLIEDDLPVLCYAIEAEKKDFFNLSIGIRKYRKDIPFEGNWNKNFCRICTDMFKLICKLHDNLSRLDYWKNLPEDIQYWLQVIWLVPDKEWIAWLPFPPRYRMKFSSFYLHVLENGVDAVSEIYFEIMKGLKNASEHYIDGIAKIYKERREQ